MELSVDIKEMIVSSTLECHVKSLTLMVVLDYLLI